MVRPSAGLDFSNWRGCRREAWGSFSVCHQPSGNVFPSCRHVYILAGPFAVKPKCGLR